MELHRWWKLLRAALHPKWSTTRRDPHRDPCLFLMIAFSNMRATEGRSHSDQCCVSLHQTLQDGRTVLDNAVKVSKAGQKAVAVNAASAYSVGGGAGGHSWDETGQSCLKHQRYSHNDFLEPVPVVLLPFWLCKNRKITPQWTNSCLLILLHFNFVSSIKQV